MKIYFAGSIRGGRDDSEIYMQIIEYLKNFGEVLTEHIGDKNLTSGGEKKDPKFIHDRDMKWVMEADVIVAEVTNPSLGVGYEIGRALENDKKILALFRLGTDKNLSFMIKGSDKIETKEYETLNEARKTIDEFFKNV